MPFVRLAKPSDYARIAAFDEWNYATQEVIALNECFVAGVGDEIRAYAEYTTWFHHRPFIATLFVHSEHRREGLGNMLLAHIESICKREKLWTSTRLDNAPMQGLLHERGYRMAGVIDNLGTVPELIYYKELSDEER